MRQRGTDLRMGSLLVTLGVDAAWAVGVAGVVALDPAAPTASTAPATAPPSPCVPQATECRWGV